MCYNSMFFQLFNFIPASRFEKNAKIPKGVQVFAVMRR